MYESGLSSISLTPISLNPDHAQWYPNYTLHLVGGGVTYSYLIEYYTHHEVEYPVFFSLATYWTYHFSNEVVENTGQYFSLKWLFPLLAILF